MVNSLSNMKLSALLAAFAALLSVLAPTNSWSDHFSLKTIDNFESGSQNNAVEVRLQNASHRQGVHAEITFDPTVLSVSEVVPGERTGGTMGVHYNVIADGRLAILIFDDQATRNGISAGDGEIASIRFNVSLDAVPESYTPILVSAATLADSLLEEVTDNDSDSLNVRIGGPNATALATFDVHQQRDGGVVIRWRLREGYGADTETHVRRRSLPDGPLVQVDVEPFQGSGPHELEDRADEVRRGGEFERVSRFLCN